MPPNILLQDSLLYKILIESRVNSYILYNMQTYFALLFMVYTSYDYIPYSPNVHVNHPTSFESYQCLTHLS